MSNWYDLTFDLGIVLKRVLRPPKYTRKDRLIHVYGVVLRYVCILLPYINLVNRWDTWEYLMWLIVITVVFSLINRNEISTLAWNSRFQKRVKFLFVRALIFAVVPEIRAWLLVLLKVLASKKTIDSFELKFVYFVEYNKLFESATTFHLQNLFNFYEAN